MLHAVKLKQITTGAIGQWQQKKTKPITTMWVLAQLQTI
jgi:hypothetical protein